MDRHQTRNLTLDPVLLRTTIESVTDAIVVTTSTLDPPGPVIEYVNPAFTAMTGYRADEVIGRSPRILQGPETDRATLDRLRAALIAGQSFTGEAINYRKDGRKFYIEWHVSAVRDETGDVHHWIAVQRDVTERRRMQARQNALITELQHRTRNLLAVVDAVARRTLPPTPALSEYHERLAALGRAQGLLSSDETWPGSLAQLVEAELHAHGVGTSERVQIAGPAFELPGDKLQPMAMVIHELATNALKYGALAQPAGRLHVTWSIEKSSATDGGGRLRLLWHESGVPLQGMLPERKGFGRELIERTLPYQFCAETSYEFTSDGLRCLIIMPIAT